MQRYGWCGVMGLVVGWVGAAGCGGSDGGKGGGEGMGACQDACSAAGEAVCVGALEAALCVRGADGCLALVPFLSCPMGQTCVSSAGQSATCRASCQDSCSTQGDTMCAGEQIQTCVRGADGCLAYAPPQPCLNGDRCTTAPGAPAYCSGTCQPSCEGRQCGDDGCGGSCGACAMSFEWCDLGRCELDVAYPWTLYVLDGAVDGSTTWDADFSAPDMRFCVTAAGGTRTCTDEVADSYVPSWLPGFGLAPIPAYELMNGVKVEYLDSDLQDDDVVCASDNFAFSPYDFYVPDVRIECPNGHIRLVLLP